MRLEKVEKCPLCGSANSTLFESGETQHAIMSRKCGECGLLYMDNVVHPEDVHLLYGQYTVSRDTATAALTAKRQKMYELDRAYMQMVIAPNAQVLDVGCGQGDFLGPVKTIQKFGLEVDAPALVAGKEKYPDTTFYASFADVPADIIFDAIVFRGTLQYMTDLPLVKEFCDAHLVSGGKIILLAAPNADSLLAQLQKEHWVLFSRNEHRYCFGRAQVERLFGSSFATTHYDLPYLGTPYENYPEDLKAVLAMYAGGEALKRKTPFFGSMMSMVLEKNNGN